MSLMAGARIGPYEILAPLGAGGMGEVYRARDTRLGREVAVKVLPADLAGHQDRLTRFEQEARASSALNHPNIVTLYEIGNQDSVSYIVMELVDGKTIREMLTAGPIPLRKLINLTTQLADGLARAHAAGIVHRDLKPENVMVTRDGFCKILDFGLAKLTGTPSEQVSELRTMTRTAAGTIVGTVGYMSPEQAAGQSVDFRSDQFSFGIILYEMLTGKRAFQRNTPVETLSAIIKEEPEPIQVANPQAPAPIRWIIERCLAKDPEDRFASTRDLARDLQSIRDHFSEVGTSTDAVTLAAPTARMKRKVALAIVALTGILLGVVATLFIARAPERPPVQFHTLTYSGRDFSPAASPDGRLIAFVSDRDGLPRIWLMELSGGNEVALTSGPDFAPRFSPDGSTIFFIRDEGNNTSALYRTSVVGGEPRKVMEGVSDADISPDGTRLIVVKRSSLRTNINNSNLLEITSLEGGNARELYRMDNGRLGAPRWSPDGKFIVLTVAPPGNVNNRILLLDSATGSQRFLDPPEKLGQISNVSWSDATHIVYGHYLKVVVQWNPPARVIRQDIRSGKAETLFWALNTAGNFDVMKQGRILFDLSLLRQNLKEAKLHPATPEISERWLTHGSSMDRQPSYSRNGEWVIFSSNRSENMDLWKISTKTGATIRVTDDVADDWDPAFTFEGKHILWSSNRNGHFEIWTASADGSGARQITNDGADAENPTQTPDGQWIIYASYNPTKNGVWKIRPDGTGAQRLVVGSLNLPDVSPDGQYALYSNIPQSWIRVVRTSDGKVDPFEIRLSAVSSPFWVSGRARWMPDGKSIVYVDGDEKGNSGLRVQDFVPGQDTSKSREVLLGFEPDFRVESMGIAPDGSRLTVSGFEVLSSLMIADNVPFLSSEGR